MDCIEFEKHIHDYFSDPDFDWKLRDKMDTHYFECDKCFEIYRIAKLMADKEIKNRSAHELGKIQVKKADKHLEGNNISEAIKFLQEALELMPGDEEIQKRLEAILIPNIFLDGVKQSFIDISGRLLLKIKSPGKLLIEYLGGIEITRFLSAEDIFLDKLAFDLKSEDVEPLIFETENMIIQLFKKKDVCEIEIKFKR